MSNERKVVVAGDKYDGPNLARLKLHEEYGRVWVYLCDDKGRSLQNGRLLCIDADGFVRIAVEHTYKYDEAGLVDGIVLEWPG